MSSNRANPYSTAHLWDADTLAAWQSMPLNRAGMIVSLHSTPDALLPAAEAAWREWCGKTPRKLWPTWIDTWAAVKRLRGRNA